MQKVNFGYGPKLIVTPRFELRVFPWGGSIAFKDSRINTSLDDRISDALDQQPIWKQIFISSSGCIVLALIAIEIGGAKGFDEFIGAFHLFLVRVFDFSAFSSMSNFLNTTSLSNQFMVVAAKFAALNLIPYLGSNGLYLVSILFKGFWPDFEFGQRSLRIIGIFSLTFFGLWLANLVHFLVS